MCAHLVIVSGHCPNGPGQALVSSRSFVPDSDATLWLGGHDWQLGTKIVVTGFSNPDYQRYLGFNGASHVNVQIVGTYRPKDTADPYWFGHNYFDQHPGGVNPETAPHLDSLFVTQTTMLTIGDPSFVAVDFDYPLTASAVRLNNENAQRNLVAAFLRHQTQRSPLAADSELGRVLSAADHERDLVNVGTLLVILQLGLLAWLVLFQVVADAIEARGNEIAMAKLRGHTAAGHHPVRAQRAPRAARRGDTARAARGLGGHARVRVRRARSRDSGDHHLGARARRAGRVRRRAARGGARRLHDPHPVGAGPVAAHHPPPRARLGGHRPRRPAGRRRDRRPRSRCGATTARPTRTTPRRCSLPACSCSPSR